MLCGPRYTVQNLDWVYCLGHFSTLFNFYEYYIDLLLVAFRADYRRNPRALLKKGGRRAC